MLTFEQVLEIFKDYLETDDEVEVLLTKRGYLRIVWPGDFSFCESYAGRRRNCLICCWRTARATTSWSGQRGCGA